MQHSHQNVQFWPNMMELINCSVWLTVHLHSECGRACVPSSTGSFTCVHSTINLLEREKHMKLKTLYPFSPDEIFGNNFPILTKNLLSIYADTSWESHWKEILKENIHFPILKLMHLLQYYASLLLPPLGSWWDYMGGWLKDSVVGNLITSDSIIKL